MRILHAMNHSERLSGNVHAGVDLACAQAEMGHDVLLCSSGGDFDAVLSTSNVEHVIINQRRSVFTIMKAVFALRRLVKQREIEIVHAHMMTSAVIAWVATIFTNASLVTTTHNAFERFSLLMGLGSRVISVSDVVKDIMVERGVARSRIRVVLNGTIGAARLRHAHKIDAELQSGSIMYIGGLHPRKGLPNLLRAYDQIYVSGSTPKLYVVGDGPQKDEYVALASKLASAPGIEFLGPTAWPLQLLKFADIFVLPSLADPAPLVIAEAREAGCAIVASDVDGIPEMLSHGNAGILVPPNDIGRLATAIERLVSNPNELRDWKAASQINIDHLNIRRVAEETLKIYQDLLPVQKMTVEAVTA